MQEEVMQEILKEAAPYDTDSYDGYRLWAVSPGRKTGFLGVSQKEKWLAEPCERFTPHDVVPENSARI